MKKHNIALIGCGRIGFLLEDDPLRNKPCTHYGGLTAAGMSVNCAADTNTERLSAFARKAGLPPENIFPNHKELFGAAAPDAVIIATWTPTHNAIAIDAAQNGARCVVLEKPVSHSLKETSNLLRECEKNKTRLIINHERRFDSRYRKVKTMIENGLLGEIRAINARILTGPYRGSSSPLEGGGPLLHDGTHLVDICRFFLGEIDTVRGEFKRFERKTGYEDRAAAWLRTVSGADIFIEAGGGYSYFVFELEIFGTRGKILIGNGYEKFYKSAKSALYVNFNDLKEAAFPKFKKDNCFTNLYMEVKDILDGKDIPLTSSGTDGYKALEIVHAIYYSAHKNGKTVKLPVNPEKISIKKIFGLRS
ncbi:MAG: Gfo/Idh/MocA family oxidoreductase [Leptospirales bacterium]|nr:Gfo/Idh/MocA family oxidoreductase [Leptospirales bacterium]